MKRRILPMIMAVIIILSIIQMPAWAATGDDPAGEDGNPGQVSEQPVEESAEPSAPVEEEPASNELPSLPDGETEEEPAPEERAKNYVAEVNGKKFTTLQAAIDAIENEGIITLLTDVSGAQISEYKQMRFYDANKTITIDLKGKTITASATEAINIHAPGLTLTIKNGTIINRTEGDYSDGIYAFYDRDDVKHQSNNLNLTLEDIKLDSRTQAIAVQGNTTNSNVTLDNCVITSDTLGIYYPPKTGTLYISDTSITAPTGVVIKGSSVEISGNTHISATGEKVDPDDYYHGDPNSSLTLTGDAIYVESGYNDRDISLKITGGTFESKNGDAVRMYIKAEEETPVERDISISGGTFSSDVSEYLADNTALTPNADGTFEAIEASESKAVALTNIDGAVVAHMSLADAITAINSADPASEVTLTLQQSQILTDTITFNKNLNITVDLNGKVLRGPSNGYVFQFGSFTATGGGAADQDYTNTGTLTIKNGTVIGYRGVMNYFGNVVLDKGLSMEANERIVNMRGGKVTVQGAKLTSEAGYGILLFNSFYAFDSDPKNPEYANNNHKLNKGAELVMISGSIDVALSAVSGNNLASAGSKATISGGTLNVNESGTAIYWPMEGELTITGGSITGGTAIEAKMGTIIISGDAQITGTGKYTESEPENGGSSPEGSALLLSSQMYGNYEGQCRESNELTVKITGGTLTSQNGNAVTVYNTEQQTGDDAQTTDVAITGGKLSGELGAIVSVVASDKNEVTTGENQQTASKSQTTLTVSGDVAPASINADGKTTYYTTVSDAVEGIENSEDETQISVFGNTTISTDVELKANITLVVAPGVTLSADVTSGESDKVVTVTTDEDDNTIYKLAEEPDDPTTTYTASITDAEENVLSYFDTLANAVKTVQDGQIITLLRTTSEGTITVSRPVSFTINPGTTTGNSYTIAAGSGYVLSVSGNTYTITAYVPPTPVDPGDDDDHGSSSSTSVRRYDIKADAGRGGDISPDGRVRVRRGENQTFRITADDGYEIYDVEVDGESVGAVSRYTFENVREDHTISATFRQTGAQTEEAQLPFLDVAEGAWYYDAVAYCYENGIMDGTSSVSFAPGMLLNRAMAAQVLYNLADGTASTAAGFPDVAASAWYADAVNWAAANGYVTGYDNGSFGPEDSLTREQLAVILYRYAGSPEPTGSLDGFTDAASTSDYAVDALRWAVGEGLLTGKDGGRLDPAGTASRAELAQILARFAQM